ncbi:MAG TPA: ABC transporter ATP-binding protein [Steroidobacteraceae bacterium]|jgi:branched-chain amino acid transport system ATP-binding protein
MTLALQTRDLSRDWGKFRANDGIALKVSAGARHALIGPNGAGKTTLIHLLSGLLKPTDGDIWLYGERITQLAPADRVARGLVRTFQISSLFHELTVLRSVLIPICQQKGIATAWYTPLGKLDAECEEAHELLSRLDLWRDRDTVVGTLAYGRQRLLDIALALAARPKMLLLDEPAAGVPEGESAELIQIIADLPRDVTVLLIEHDMDLVFRFAETITVMVAGRILTEGSVAEVVADARVREVYLGETSHV